MAKKAKKKATSKKAVKKTSGNWMETYELLKSTVAEMETDAIKFDQGTKASAGRLRKAAMQLKRTAGDFRKQVQEAKASM